MMGWIVILVLVVLLARWVHKSVWGTPPLQRPPYVDPRPKHYDEEF